jgi:hypothetical protein
VVNFLPRKEIVSAVHYIPMLHTLWRALCDKCWWKDTSFFNTVMHALTLTADGGESWEVSMVSAPLPSIQSGLGPFKLPSMQALKNHMKGQHCENEFQQTMHTWLWNTEMDLYCSIIFNSSSTGRNTWIVLEILWDNNGKFSSNSRWCLFLYIHLRFNIK